MFDAELQEFKTAIDLRAFAATQGYRLDAKESYRGSAVMRHPESNDKIMIKRSLDDGHYLWFSVRTNSGGTIIDFVRHLRRASLGEIRMELRPWIGKPPIAVPEFPDLVGTTKDRMKVAARFARTKDASSGHPYLEDERAIPSSLLALRRFAGRVRIDARSNAVFPHFDANGLCGYELKNRGWTGFASGGTKGLWLSQEFAEDERLVICESAIDALSFAALFGEERTRFASIAGKLNPLQPALIRAAIERLPPNAEVVAAMDADEEGRKLAGVVRETFEATQREDLRFRVQEPDGFKDLNDQLRSKNHARPAPPLPVAEPR